MLTAAFAISAHALPSCRTIAVGEDDAPDSAVGYAYDELGRTVSETSQGVCHLHTYDLAGHELVRQNQSTGRRIDRYYDGAGRLVMVNEGGRQTWVYYDLAGNVKQQREKWNINAVPERPDGTRITSMDYDGAYRLTTESITEPGGGTTVTGYTYDDANNRTAKTVTGGEEPGAWTYTSNARNHLTGFTRTSGTHGPASVSYSYDDNGNRQTRTADGVTDTYSWDEENRLTQVDKDGALHKYGYDYRTRRISREEPQSGTGFQPVKTAVVFAGGLSVAEYEIANGVISNPAVPTVEYIRGPDLGGGVGGMLYSLRAVAGALSPAAKYTYPNGRGDVVAQADQTGALTWTASYEAFGTHKKETGTNLDRQRANTKEEDPTGLLNEGFRYRDLETGTWLSRDPAGFVDGPNLYGYVRCNPWTKFDPMGLESAWDSIWSDAGEVAYDSIDSIGLVQGPKTQERKADFDRRHPTVGKAMDLFEQAASMPGVMPVGGPMGTVVKGGSAAKAATLAANVEKGLPKHWLGSKQSKQEKRFWENASLSIHQKAGECSIT